MSLIGVSNYVNVPYITDKHTRITDKHTHITDKHTRIQKKKRLLKKPGH